MADFRGRKKRFVPYLADSILHTDLSVLLLHSSDNRSVSFFNLAGKMYRTKTNLRQKHPSCTLGDSHLVTGFARPLAYPSWQITGVVAIVANPKVTKSPLI